MCTFEKNEKNQAVITVTVSGEEFEKAIEQAYHKTAGRYAIAGFRKGKAPRKLIEKYYGEGVFFEDAFNEVCGPAYGKALDELKLIPVSRPEIDIKEIKDDKSVVFTATVDLKPEVELGKYKGIKIEKNEYTVSDEDVQRELDAALDRASRMVEVEGRAVKEGDTVTLDYSGSVDGVKFPGGTAENQTLVIGSHTFIPGFEEQMVGMEIGQEKDIEVKFPEDYHAQELKGKDAVFAVKVHGIKEKQVPELDDEFAKDVSEFDTLEEYKADIRANLQKKNEERADNEYEVKLVDAVCDEAKVEIPESMIERQLDYQMNDMAMRLSYQGVSMEDYFKYTGSDEKQMRDMYRPDAEKTVRRQLVLEAVKDAEKIEALPEDIDKELAKYAEMFKKSVEEYKAGLKPEELEYFTDSAVVNKTLEFLKENNQAVKPAAKKAAKKPAAKKTAKKAADAQEKEADAADAEQAQEKE
jgi:trigger factor